MTESYELPGYGHWYERWGHYAPRLLSVAIAAAIALGVHPRSASAASLLLSIALIGFVLATWFVMRAHDRKLCEACAASMPLNPAERAVRFRRRLQLAHQASNPYLLVPYLLILLGTNFLMSPVGRYIWAATQATLIYLILANSTHRLLQPWCPGCSGGGGGGNSPADLPEPTGPRGNVKQLA